MSTTLDEIHNLLEIHSSKRKQADLQHFLNLMERLDNPQTNIDKVIHVAGTNGKGSVVAMLNSILQEAGFSVHTTTSPHLISVLERIQISNQRIEADLFLNTLKEIICFSKELPLTYFELITAVAIVNFSRIKADYILLETGLGGKHDATNIFKSPLVTIITSISNDHMNYFGPTYKDIAREKAGIIKPGVPVVTCKQLPEVMEVIQKEAEVKNAPLYIVPEDHTYDLSLVGNFQQQNAALAAKAISFIEAFDGNTVLIGLRNATWQGRLHHIEVNGKEYWLDIAHNEESVKAVLEFIEEKKIENISVVFSLKKDRDPAAYLDLFKGKVKSISYLEQDAFNNCHDFESISIAALKSDLKVEKTNVSEVLKKEVSTLITGSSVIVGSFLEILKT